MQTLSQIKLMLEERGLAPRKALGQNFLIDKNLLARLVDAAAVQAGDLVLEVGPGTGTLTEELVGKGCRVVACELDEGLAGLLEERVPGLGLAGRFELVRGDCLEAGRHVNRAVVERLGGGPFALVANLPYQAATPLMLALLIEHPACGRMAVTIQREVAQRLTAKPGTKEYGTLGIVAQAMAEVRQVATLPRECFWPRPDVTSAMVVVERRAKPLTDDPAGLAAFCQRLFSQRRKQLGTTLGREMAWPPGVRPEQRPEELGVAEMVLLARVAAGSGESRG